MKKNNYFLAFPFSIFCEDDSDILSNEAKKFFKELTSLFKNNNISYYSAQEREKWGKNYNTEQESTKYDFEAMKMSDTVICVPGNPYSGGTHIELGWASALKKKIILLLERDVYYSPLVRGVAYMTNVEIYYYSDFYQDIILIIENIVNKQYEIKIIKNYLSKNHEKFFDYKNITGGNHNKLYLVNHKYFVKFKDELSVKEESLYFKKEVKYSPKLYYSNVKNKLLIYELLNAKDLEEPRTVDNLIDIVYDYSKNHVSTKLKGFGYYGIENKTWIDFLTQEVNVSKMYFKKNNYYIESKIVDEALNNIKKYKFHKKILHGDFGMHNTMITKKNNLYFIDPEPVLGDYIYDFIFYCFSDVSLLKMISFNKIIDKINEDENKVKSMMIIVMFNRLRRILKYSSEDFDTYYEYWKKLGDLYYD